MIGGHYSNDERMDKKTPRQDGKRGKDTENNGALKQRRHMGRTQFQRMRTKHLKNLSSLLFLSTSFCLSLVDTENQHFLTCLPPNVVQWYQLEEEKVLRWREERKVTNVRDLPTAPSFGLSFSSALLLHSLCVSSSNDIGKRLVQCEMKVKKEPCAFESVGVCIGRGRAEGASPTNNERVRRRRQNEKSLVEAINIRTPLLHVCRFSSV